MIIHSFTSKAARDAAAADLATRWKKVTSFDLSVGEDLYAKDFDAALAETAHDPVTFPNRYLVVAGEPKPQAPTL